jgi:hypothetical protein
MLVPCGRVRLSSDVGEMKLSTRAASNSVVIRVDLLSRLPRHRRAIVLGALATMTAAA